VVFAEQSDHFVQVAIQCVEFLNGVLHVVHLVGQYRYHILYYFYQRKIAQFSYGVDVFSLDEFFDDFVALIGQAVLEDHFDEIYD
jgi:hypothetical protein